MEIPSKPKPPKPPPPPLQLDELEEVEDDEEVVEGAVVEAIEEVEEVEEIEVAAEDEGILTEEDVEVVEDEEEDDGRPRRKKKDEEPARRGTPRKEHRTMAMLIHLLGIFTWFIGPLILWLIKRKESRFIDHHGKEALNLQITLFIGWLILFVALFVLVGVMASSQLVGGAVISGLILYGFMLLLGLFGLVTSIIACVQANGGKWYRHPAIMHPLK